MLTTEDIKKILKKKKNFGGVFPSDSLPVSFEKPKSFIINLDPRYKEGSHWVAVKFDKYGKGYYFNSFGGPPEGSILSFIEKHSPNGYTFTPDKYQGNLSTSCGYFCIFFIVLGIKKFIKLFTRCKYEKNEIRLLKLLKKILIVN